MVFIILNLFSFVVVLKYVEKTPKESPKQQNFKCCRLSLIEPVYGC